MRSPIADGKKNLGHLRMTVEGVNWTQMSIVLAHYPLCGRSSSPITTQYQTFKFIQIYLVNNRNYILLTQIITLLSTD